MESRLVLTVAAEAHLAGAPASLREALKKELTIANPAYQDAKKYGRWVGKKLKPFLYYFREDKDGLTFPRGFANGCVALCRRAAPSQELEIVDQRQVVPEVALTFTGQLRPYQAEALQAIQGRDFGVLESGTGSGKTIIALAVFAARRQPTLVVVHTKELLYQWAERIETFLGIKAGLIGDGHFELAPVTVGIVNSVRNRLDELTDKFGQLCVDECHRVPATLFTDVVTAFPCRYMLGLSATAFRRDGLTRIISFYLGDPVHRVDPERLHTSGAVLRPEFIQHLTGFTFNYHDNYQQLMTSLTTDEDRNRQIADDVAGEVSRQPGTILVVSDRVAHCEKLAELLTERGVRTVVLTGRLATEARSEIVEGVRNNAYQVLVATVQLIGEGFDCPDLSTLFLTTPIKFTGRILQVVGRILRPSVGKQPRVFDYLDPVGVLKSSARARRNMFLEQQQGVLPLDEA
jgi:superfamily II DNA or RNA helicase